MRTIARKRSTLVVAVLTVLFSAAGRRALGTELLINGGFEAGFQGWANHSVHFDGTPRSAGVAVAYDQSNTSALQLSGVVGSNYNLRVEQDVVVAGLGGPVEVSFDWKVTSKEPYYGVNYVLIDFRSAANAVIGRVIYFDTSNPNYTLDYFRTWPGNGPPENAYFGMRKYNSTFDWEHVSVSSANLPGLALVDVRSIHVRLNVQNDASFGGEMFVDNLSVTVLDDCNVNGVNDALDIAGGTSRDCLDNGTPDECELVSDACPYLPGDINNDGAVDDRDVTQFTLVLLNLNSCMCSVLAADMNADGVVDFRDIRPFRQTVRCELNLAHSLHKPVDEVDALLHLARELNVELDLAATLNRNERHQQMSDMPRRRN